MLPGQEWRVWPAKQKDLEEEDQGLPPQPTAREQRRPDYFTKFHDADDGGHLVEGEVALRDGGEVAVQPAHHRAHHTVAKPALSVKFGLKY